MTILVTGGAGYIGSHVIKELLGHKHDVVVLDSLECGHRDAVLSEKFYQADIQDRTALEHIFQKESIDLVLHFAGYLSVPESVVEPEKYYENNVAGTINLLSVMRAHGCSKIIFSSSAAVYGEPESTPITEDHTTRPINPYGHSKLIIEQILKSYFDAYGVRSVSLRYFCAAGADPDGQLGERHDPETHVIPLLVKAALADTPFYIYGDDYPTRDGSCVRDFIHVTDLADAHVRAINLLENPVCTYFNLGSENGYSVKELVTAMEKIVRKKINAVVVERRHGDPHALVASSQKIREALGWTPQYSSLEKILQTALAFLKKG
ncbi:MAG: UDP-glucose 4-epimerase GalE [Candidatus Uhrbacteria bacterium]|nr:UDP-glucose 4-epimerase GalE [Candidatus Uhrbacteria bacterium]